MSDEMRTIKPDSADPYGPFRLREDINHYPYQHPDTSWDRDGVFVFYSPSNREIRINTTTTRYQPTVYSEDELPEFEWVRVSDKEGAPYPLAIRRDAGGVQGRWLRLD